MKIDVKNKLNADADCSSEKGMLLSSNKQILLSSAQAEIVRQYYLGLCFKIDGRLGVKYLFFALPNSSLYTFRKSVYFFDEDVQGSFLRLCTIVSFIFQCSKIFLKLWVSFMVTNSN